MASSFTDVILDWLGTGPGRPHYTQMLGATPERLRRFGHSDGASVWDALTLQPAVDQLHAPVNGMLWHVPAIPADVHTWPEVLREWPALKRIDGTPFVPSTLPLGEILEGDLLLEVWPSSFRRLEYLFSSLDVPVRMAGWDQPQLPVPRWFWLRGVGSGIETPAQNIADAQHPGQTPSLQGFLAGKVPLYVACGDQLATFAGIPLTDPPLIVRTFDALGLVIDPDYVFATFQRLGEDSEFQKLRINWRPSPPIADWRPPARHVLVFSDAVGRPYVSRADPDPSPEPGAPPPVVPPRQLLVHRPSEQTLDIPAHGVVVVDDGEPVYDSLKDTLVEFELPGEHQRVGLLPHGELGITTKASFAQYTFLRVLVVDFARWFPHNPNPLNWQNGADALQRYTDGNELIPLVDGQSMLRALYRALRSTYTRESYVSDDHVPQLDPSAVPDPLAPPVIAGARILLNNAWIEPDTALLGRRAMLRTPRTQPGFTLSDLPGAPGSADSLLSRLRVVGAISPTGLDDFAAGDPGHPLAGHRLWWLLYTPPPLPTPDQHVGRLAPGVYVELRQLTILTAFRGDDPRLPGTELNADLYGITGPLGVDSPTAWGFVGSDGHLVLPLLLKAGETPTAMLRVVLWKPAPDDVDPISTATSGKGRRYDHAYGEVTLPLPPGDPGVVPEFSRDGVNLSHGIRLEFDGTPGRAQVVLEPAVLTKRVPVVVVNARTGEINASIRDANPSTAIRIPVEPFALNDRVLVGFPTGAVAELADCDVFFTLLVSAEQLTAGAADAHPTELLGALRVAINEGVDTRVLAWHNFNVLPKLLPYKSLGVVDGVNALVNGKQGQAIFDQLARREIGVHHQKGSFVRSGRPASEDGGAIAFLGGIDTVLGRWDHGPHDAVDPDRPSTPWHDIHCRVRGRAAWDVYRNYRQRWNAALQHPDLAELGPTCTPLPAVDPTDEDDTNLTVHNGPHTVQIDRTIAPRIEAYSAFVDPDHGDLSLQKAYHRVIAEAQHFIYIEDQYFWNRDIASRLHAALVDPDRRLAWVMVVLPKRLDEFDMADLALYAQRRRNMSLLLYGQDEVPTDPSSLGAANVADRVILCSLKNDRDEPVYVHCKVMVIDDLWMMISSSNLSRRSMTYDSEIGAAAIDKVTRRGGQRTARDFRVDLMSEHLRLAPDERSLVEDPRDAFRLVRDTLDGLVPGRNPGLEKAGIAEQDLFHTHYGIQPSNLDGTFIDAINAVMDPDGTRLDLPVGAVDARQLLEALAGAGADVTFGGLSTLRLDFDVTALGVAPSTVQVRVELRLATTPPAPPSQTLTLGPFPADARASLGLTRIGFPYVIHANAETRAEPHTPLGAFEDQITPSAFLTTETLVLTLPVP